MSLIELVSVAGLQVEAHIDKLQLDHCHITGKFRGWLCYSCNLGLGKLRDSVELLQRGIKYLKGEIENEEDKQED